jgi:hypothetical protein
LFTQAKDVSIFFKNVSFTSSDGPLPFKAELKGERSQDIGGVFREIIEQICTEIQSPSLPLLIKTANNKNAFGLNREKWTINSGSASAAHMELFSFLGVLMGMSFRAGHTLALNLPTLVWKQILGDPIDRSDLKGVDAFCVQV